MSRKAVVAGGTGLIGTNVREYLHEAGYDVTVLSRGGTSDGTPDTFVRWDGKTQGAWTESFEGADLVINLCGQTLQNRWTSSYRQKLISSRVDPTKAIAEAIANCANPPKCWINASGAHYYGEQGNKTLTENAPAGTDFLAQLVKQWESPVIEAELPKTRKVRMRFGVVLGNGGAFKPFLMLSKLGLFGKMGTGHQYFPWIHILDLCRMMLWVADGEHEGVYNAVAPHLVTQATFASMVRAAVGVPVGLPAPEFGVNVVFKLLKWEPEFLLGSVKAQPFMADSQGFQWHYPNLQGALADLMESLTD